MRKGIGILLAICLLLTSCTAPPSEDAVLELHMLSIGNADCFLLTQGEAAVLIDGGNPQDADYILSYLHESGVDRLDALIISHWHTDHIGGLEQVLEAYAVDAVYCTAFPEDGGVLSLMYERLNKCIRKQKAMVYDVRDGATFFFGKAQVEIYPTVVSSEETNEQSVVARVRFGKDRILFMGDAEEEMHTALMASGMDIRATVIKMSHHGGKINTTRSLLDRVNPDVALISCGIEANYRNPHEDTVAALEERGITAVRTDRHGDVKMSIRESGERFIEVSRE